MLDSNRLQQLVHIKTLCFDTIDSTSTYIKENCLSNDDILVCADNQDKGRGRRGKEFFSRGGIYFSFLYNYLPNEDISKLTLLVAVAIHKVLTLDYNIDCSIKWVNDIIYNDKKVAGILCEKIPDRNAIIVGIGMNVNIDVFPIELIDIATSLHIDNLDKELFISQIVNQIYTMLKEHTPYMDYYRDNCCVLNKEVFFSDGTSVIKGIATSIEDDGRLVVKVNNKVYYLNSGEISIRLNH